MLVESLEFWKNLFEISGVVLLLLTFVAGAGVLWFSRKLNAIQATELRDFRLKFEGEQQKTASAQKEAAEAKRIANGFDQEIAAANQRATEAKTAQLRVETELAKQRERAASAETELLKLKNSLQDRVLSPEQEERMLSVLKRSKGCSVGFMWTTSAPDAYGLMSQIKRVLINAGWPKPGDVQMSGGRAMGIGLVVRDLKHPPECLGLLQEAFAATDLKPHVGAGPKPASTEVMIVITARER